jgi:TPR repeat protein
MKYDKRKSMFLVLVLLMPTVHAADDISLQQLALHAGNVSELIAGLEMPELSRSSSSSMSESSASVARTPLGQLLMGNSSDLSEAEGDCDPLSSSYSLQQVLSVLPESPLTFLEQLTPPSSSSSSTQPTSLSNLPIESASPQEWYVMGAIYHKGHCGIRYSTKQDYVQALKCYENALKYSKFSDASIAPLMWVGMANIYHSGGCGVKRDYAKALELYEKVSTVKDFSAMSIAPLLWLDMARIYHFGKYGSKQDCVKTLELCEKVSNVPDFPTMWVAPRVWGLIAQIYKDDCCGINPDYKKSIECYEKISTFPRLAAISQANPLIQIGRLYSMGGYGISRDGTMGQYYFSKALDKRYLMSDVEQRWITHNVENIKRSLTSVADTSLSRSPVVAGSTSSPTHVVSNPLSSSHTTQEVRSVSPMLSLISSGQLSSSSSSSSPSMLAQRGVDSGADTSLSRSPVVAGSTSSSTHVVSNPLSSSHATQEVRPILPLLPSIPSERLSFNQSVSSGQSSSSSLLIQGDVDFASGTGREGTLPGRSNSKHSRISSPVSAQAESKRQRAQEWYCQVCNVHLASKQGFQAHENTHRHKANMLRVAANRKPDTDN